MNNRSCHGRLFEIDIVIPPQTLDSSNTSYHKNMDISSLSAISVLNPAHKAKSKGLGRNPIVSKTVCQAMNRQGG